MASFSDYTKKKKNQTAENVSFTDYTKAVLGRNDIAAPTNKTYKVTEENDIAPVKDTSGYFQKSAHFDNGYQFGDVAKTAGATAADVGENAVKGGANWLEKLWDGLLTFGAMMNEGTMMEAAQNEMIYNAVTGKDNTNTLSNYQKAQAQVEKETAEYVAKDIIKEENIDFGVDDYSVLGEKSDALVQSGTELLIREGVKRIPYVGVPLAYMSTAASVMGGEAENAFNQDATFDEAFASGVNSVAAEMGTEALFGGIKIGNSTITDGFVKKATSIIPSKFWRTLAKWGINTVGEGVEEDLSGYLSAVGQKMTYLNEKELDEIYTSEDHWDNFLGGVILGGFFEGVSIPIANKKGIDYVTGLKNNEKAVVDKVYNDAIAEAEAGGKKLTTREKTKIFDEVVEQAEKGYISTDTIEEVLGGERYAEYKSAVEKENALQSEFDSLNKMKQGEMTGEQIDRRAELKQQLAEIRENFNTAEMKTKLGDEVFSLVKDSKLVESYNEKSRRGQAFEADLSQFEGKQKEAVERAIKSGVLNNTNRSHELVNVLSKIEADKGIVFDYTNNEKLKESGFAIEGKTVNGFANKGKGTVTLNVQSAKAWQSTVGHEIGHILKGTDAYDVLQNTLFEYAESKGELESRRAALTELYKDIETDIDEELTCDLIGDYLFSDKDFINKLTGNRTLFQKVYDEIKYLCKVATGKELTQIEKVKQEFDKVWKDFSVNPKADTSVMTREEYDMWRVEELNRLNPQLSNTIKGEIVDGVYLDGESTDGMQNMVGSHYGSTIRRTKDAKVGTFTHEILHTIDMLSGYNVRSYVEDLANGKGFDNYNDLLNYLKTAREQGKIDGRTTNAEETAQMVLQAFYSDREGLRSVTPEFCAYLEEMGLDKYSHLAQNYDQYRASVKSKSVDNQNPTDNPDIRFSLSQKPIISKLTGKEISEQTYATLDKLERGESVTLEELDSLPEVIEGNLKRDSFAEKIIAKYPELKDVPFDEVGTHLIDSAEREQKRNDVLQTCLKSGSFTGIDNNDEEVYNGSVEKGKRLDIVIGLAAAGKSSAIVNPLSEYYKSVIVDSDIIKKQLPEFNGGWGASLVHVESSNLNAKLFDRLTQTGSNIVLPIVGAKTNDVEDYINLAKAQDYEVHLHLNELNSSKAMGRMLIRYFKDGRFIPPEISWKNGDKPTAVFEEFKNRGDLNGYSHWDNDVQRGKRPNCVEVSENLQTYAEFSASWRARRIADTESSIGESSQGERTTNQIAPIKETSSVDGVFFDGEKRSLSNKGEQFAPVGNYSTPLNETALAPTKEDISAMENTDSVDGEAPFFTDYDAPPVMEDTYYEDTDTTAIDDKALKGIAKTLKSVLSLNPQETKAIQEIVQKYSTSEIKDKENLFKEIQAQFGEKSWVEKNEEIAEVKRLLRGYKFKVSDTIKGDMAYKHGTWSRFRKSYSGRLNFSQTGLPIDVAYMELSSEYPAFFPSDIVNEADQLFRIAEIADMNIRQYYSQPLSDETMQEAVDIISAEVSAYKQNLTQMAAEETAREALDSVAPHKATQLVNGTRGKALLNQSLDNFPIKTVEDVVTEKIRAVESELADNQQLRREAEKQYTDNIAKLVDEYMSKKRFDTKVANNILQRISKLEKLKASVDAQYAKRISDLEARAEKMKDPKYSRAMHKKAKMQEHAQWAENLLGDTSTWVDKKLGIQYEVNTEHRNFRDVIRDADGKKDIARADAINDALSGEYNRNEAEKKRTIAEVTKPFAEMKINEAETTYIQMLGELRHNPDTTLTEKVVKEYYEKHKNKIDTAKVDKAIEEGRKAYDTALELLNAKLREQGMKEIPYRKGYFHHYTEPKQNFIQKLLNWKVQDNDIPTSIAGLTEDFKPVKSWQPFDKQRHTDTTDYNFLKGLDNYLQGAYDWIYHLEDIQKRRAIENYIRSTHSDEGVQARIEEVYANEELDADEAQAQIEQILAEGKNPLNNFVQDFMTKTNILAGKKNSLDRVMEQKTNRKIYSIMTNVQNRMSANMVLANVRSALTNFIPITQSWAQVSPLRSLQATKDTIANAIKDDGLINKSTFLTNRLREADKLYQTNWDKVLDKAGIMFEIVDNFSSQVIWRSKYNQNLSKGMTESEAIKNADQFAENVMAGRSKGNEPTLFNAKNPLVKAFTMFQLEVNNQYGYFFKDVPNDLKTETNHWKLNLAKGYTTAFIGAYVYNALMEKVAGSGAALDPIGIIEDLLRDLGLFDDDEEKELDETLLNLGENVVEELPFVGGLFGGGRIPISSALPYEDDGIKGAIEDVTEGNWKNVGKELMNPLLNVGLPVGGGQIKKTYQGLNMFNTDEDHPIAGSYTDSGKLRFPVEDTLGNRVQAGIFGQWANENARDYIENGRTPLNEKQTQEFVDVDLPIGDYWKYRDGLKGLKTNAEKADYIHSLDIKDWQKNLLMNNILDRKEDVDMSNYGDYGSYEEFDYAQKNPEEYAFAKSVGGYDSYKTYSDALYDIKADKDAKGKTITGSRKEKVLNYINNLDADYETKIILFKSEYPSDDTYNYEIIDYLNNREDISYGEMVSILKKLGFTVHSDGTIKW